MSFENREGQRIPSADFKIINEKGLQSIASDDLFKNKKVILFSLPGAFTPTCSSTHLPRYNQLAKTFAKEGVDEIVCLSVNDAFVMKSWGESQEADKVTLLADGNGEFTEKMGLLVDKSDLGFGKRSWRYSMLVNDGVIEKMFIEPDKPGDPFEVSDADTMLAFINDKAELPKAITVITKPGCPFCTKAKELLRSKDLDFEEVILGRDATSVSLAALTGQGKVPQVFVDGKRIGGSDDLEKYFS
ncbi:glutathione peroxidase [Halobacteriovorax marinus]|uniref:glutathione peroxidase n=1 Tax=Halobacteriovorax marinus TaxID=97084 RepID=UPI000BC30A65|nr:glutathione peroxidase [Halobacteriovorax marinus]ATH07658.1 glutathione peroxidase [Halobacteriovorax marinus]